MNLATDKQRFMDTEYEQEFDEYLFGDVGYDRMSEILKGVVVTPYAMTSLREYFATAFTEVLLPARLSQLYQEGLA